ncbi:MAG: 2-C-methyl-D-erythritol 4-phosphate cytidylyltransferase [Actinobacteria bacterium]|nr:2-C-methyl-D-erythritol 4-phosphate cytidylyltransferase [Actinomycetota bacterium]
MAVTAVIAAAGSGERLGAGGPKAFVPLAGRPLIEWSLAAFRGCDCVEAVVVAAPPGREPELGAGVRVVAGGATRAESVANALAAVETEVVAIHDAARPLLTSALVEALVAALAAHPDAAAVIPAAPVTDTVKRTAPAAGTGTASTAEEAASAALVVVGTEDRSTLWAAQTPQVFRTAALRAALEVDAATRDAATDEAMLVEAAGGTVLIHPSGPENLKVTTPHDLRLAELLLADR